MGNPNYSKPENGAALQMRPTSPSQERRPRAAFMLRGLHIVARFSLYSAELGFRVLECVLLGFGKEVRMQV